MKNLYKVCFSVVIIVGMLFLANYMNEARTYNLDPTSGFLAVCGTFIQENFTSYRPGMWDFFIVLISAIIVLGTLIFSIKYLIKPGEHGGHIKHQILEDEKKR